MSFFRIHIIKITVLSLFVISLIAVTWPGAKHDNAGETVSSWLLELRSETDNPTVHEKIHALKTEKEDITKLLRKASFIINAHSDDFTIPVDTSSASDEDIYNTLLLKWTLHQQGTSAKATQISERQSRATPTNDKESKPLWNQFVHSVQFVAKTYSRVSETLDFIRMLLKPLTSGIVTGAP